MAIDVQGKTALITGANRGIGKAIAEAFLQAGIGKLYAAVRDPDSARELISTYGDKVVAVELDLTKPDTITVAAATASDAEVVVNNGGILKQADPLNPDAIDNFQAELDVNVFGLMRMGQAFAPVLKANGGGVLIQLNSIASIRSFPPFATYAASKAASYSITQALAAMLGEQGTRVISVHPGPIGTDMAKQAGFDESDPPSVVADAILAALKSDSIHVFPDTMAKELWQAYQSFAKQVVESSMAEA